MGRRSDLTLSPELIASTALEIVDEEGVHALTVRRLATRLGVQGPSLYNHVSSKDEILDAVTDLVGQSIDLECLHDPDWRRAMTLFARSYRQAFAAHPWVIALAARRAVETNAALSAYDGALTRLLSAGWSPDEALRLLAAVEALVLGSAIVPFAAGFVRPPAEYAERYPGLAAAFQGAQRLSSVDDESFEVGLAALLAADPSPCAQRLEPSGG